MEKLFKRKKLLVSLGVVLTALSQSGLTMEMLTIIRRGRLPRGWFLDNFTLLIVDMVYGLLNLIDYIIKFVLSWEGALLLAVILAYVSFRQFVKDRK